jgi:hypothetical protein
MSHQDSVPNVGVDGIDVQQNGDGSYTARASFTVQRDVSEVLWIVQPQFWKPCLRQYDDLEFLHGTAPGGNVWKAIVRETVNLGSPFNFGFGKAIADLAVSVKLEPTYGWVKYELFDGGSELLDIDQGYIKVGKVEDDSLPVALTHGEIEKVVRLRSGNELATLFKDGIWGLGQLMSYWVTQASQDTSGP